MRASAGVTISASYGGLVPGTGVTMSGNVGLSQASKICEHMVGYVCVFVCVTNCVCDFVFVCVCVCVIL